MRRTDPDTRRSADRTGGFTLFEVLGAVALLAIVYTMLATAAMRGLRTEGESGRILEASMIADWQLAEIDLQIDQGLMPELGVSESEQDGFRIRIEVAEFALPELEVEAGGLLASGSSESITTSTQSQPVFGDESPLREIRLVVAWGNPENERSVMRTTYGFDTETLQIATEAGTGAGATGSPTGTPLAPNLPQLPNLPGRGMTLP